MPSITTLLWELNVERDVDVTYMRCCKNLNHLLLAHHNNESCAINNGSIAANFETSRNSITFGITINRHRPVLG